MALPQNTSPELSIIIATCGRESLLAETLRSVSNVPDLHYEVLVVDDSPDGSAYAVVQQFKASHLRYLRLQPCSNGRPALVRNFAVRESSGRLLYFLDDDDRLVAENLSGICAQLSASSAGVVVAGLRVFGTDTSKIEHERRYFERGTAFLREAQNTRDVVARLLFGDSVLMCGTCLIKREIFDLCNGFDAEIPVAEDVALFAKAIRHCGYILSDNILFERRVGLPSLSSLATPQQWALSYLIMQAHYRNQYGWLEYFSLKLRYYFSPLLRRHRNQNSLT